nr:MAG TPA: hypothetical protein [Inoviridae sp.]
MTRRRKCTGKKRTPLTPYGGTGRTFFTSRGSC